MSMFDKLKDLNNLRHQANQLKQTLSQEKITVSQNGITLEMDGNQKVLNIKIENQLDNSELESTLPALYNQALEKVQRIIAAKMQAGGLNIPGF